jgi:hypothetical protein
LPVRLGGYDTSGYAYDVAVVGSLAYVADGSSGLEVLDVSNPASPLRLGGYDTSGSVDAVQVVGSLAYVADGSSGLQILDVSNPAAPVWRGEYDTSGYACDVQVVGSLAYVADDVGGLAILRVKYPGDASLDGKVDIADLGIVGTNWQGTGKSWEQGDFNGDGIVDIIDLGIVGTNWQFGAGGVPSWEEPLAASIFADEPLGETSVLTITPTRGKKKAVVAGEEIIQHRRIQRGGIFSRRSIGIAGGWRGVSVAGRRSPVI